MDITKIEGYREGMTTEEIIGLVNGYEPDMSGYVKKSVFDKAASEAADFKKKYRSTLDDNEAKELAYAETLKELETIKREKTVSDNAKLYISAGYSAEDAQKSAEFLMNGDISKVIEMQSKYLEKVKKDIEAKLLENTPSPQNGSGNDVMTIEKFRKLSPAERLKYSQENPEDYKKIYKGD